MWKNEEKNCMRPQSKCGGLGSYLLESKQEGLAWKGVCRGRSLSYPTGGWLERRCLNDRLFNQLESKWRRQVSNTRHTVPPNRNFFLALLKLSSSQPCFSPPPLYVLLALETELALVITTEESCQIFKFSALKWIKNELEQMTNAPALFINLTEY